MKSASGQKCGFHISGAYTLQDTLGLRVSDWLMIVTVRFHFLRSTHGVQRYLRFGQYCSVILYRELRKFMDSIFRKTDLIVTLCDYNKYERIN
jgi:hypothetical protein